MLGFLCEDSVFEMALTASRAVESRRESVESPRIVLGETVGHHSPRLVFFLVAFLSLWESLGVQKTSFKQASAALGHSVPPCCSAHVSQAVAFSPHALLLPSSARSAT